MQSNYRAYSFDKSLERIDAILDSPSAFEKKEEIPSRESLTFTNGYYVNCSSLFIDLRDSSKLPEKHQSRVLAKIYRSYISEAVAIINANLFCKEVSIVGDCVSAIFSAQYKNQIDSVFDTAAQLSSLINTLNYKLTKKGYSNINAGIGLSFGQVLMIKAGYNGSSINDIVYMGEAVNKASKMCAKASKEVPHTVVTTYDFYRNLNAKNQSLLQSNLYSDPTFYYGDIINIEMNNWLNNQK